jgi:hypothetical protein
VPDPTLVATPADAAANSYLSRAEAQAFFDGRLQVDAWTDAEPADQDRALITATTRLDQERWAGTRSTTTQRLQWPRRDVLDPDGVVYDPDTIPRPLEAATAELALALLAGAVALAPSGLEGFENLSVGPIDVTPRAGATANTLPDHVLPFLRGLRTGGSGQPEIIRG